VSGGGYTHPSVASVPVPVVDFFRSCDLDLNPIIFINELDPYCLEIHGMCKYELCASRLSKVDL